MSELRHNESIDPNSLYPPLTQACYAVFVLFIAYTLASIDRSILSLMVDPVRADLNLSDFEISLLQGLAFALLFAVVGFPVSRLADRKSRRGILAAGISFWCVMTAMCGLSTNFLQLFLARMGVGMGEATLTPASASIISDYFEPKKRALALSVYYLGYPIGGGLALIIGAAILDALSGVDIVDLGFMGQYKPWQAAFFIVGLPGLAVAGLVFTFKEPRRVGVIEVDKNREDQKSVTIGELTSYIGERRKAYLSLYAAVTLLGVLAYGTVMWYPVFFMRTYDMTASEAGYSYGLMVGIMGSLGLLSGGLLSRWLGEKGYKDANVRIMIFSALAKAIPLVLAPLMPTATWALILLAPGTFFGQMAPGVNMAAFHDITPNQMRGQISAIMQFLSNTIGLGMGGILIASITDFGFGDDSALRYSLSIAVVIIIPIILGLLFYGLKHYRLCLKEAEGWNKTVEMAPEQ